MITLVARGDLDLIDAAQQADDRIAAAHAADQRPRRNGRNGR
jgi:hypothetical protein